MLLVLTIINLPK